MCGIAGIVDYTGRDYRVQLQKMTDLIRHRGPDGEGHFHDQVAWLGHRRLAIIDLSKDADQPMHDPVEQRFVIVFNGEIYNFAELRAELEALNYRFRTKSDTEVLLVAFRHFGVEAFKRLNGIFAVGIWDKVEKKLTLARDPIGVKPLFYHHTASKIVFCSEMKGILADPEVSRELDETGISSYFSYNYTPGPFTGVKAIKQVLPGAVVTFNQDGLQGAEFWRPNYSAVPLPISEDELYEELSKAIIRQTVSDVPIGSFLSGGIDSTLISLILRSQGLENSVTFFNFAFGDKKFDESAVAKENAEKLGLKLDIVTDSGSFDDLPFRVADHLEDPMADASSLACYLLYKRAAERFKVGLSGDGADELFAGYGTYVATRVASAVPGASRPFLSSLVSKAGSLIPESGARYSAKDVINRFGKGMRSGFPRNHSSWRNIWGSDEFGNLFVPSFFAKVKNKDPLKAYERHADEVPDSRDRLTKSLNMDLRFLLPNDMLVKVDRMSMAHGLEVRVPFLDLDFVTKVINASSCYKLRGFSKKVLLRKFVRERLPNQTAKLPKRGFNVPLRDLFCGKWGDMLLLLLSQNERESIIRRDTVEALLVHHRSRAANHGYKLFGVLMFLIWQTKIKAEWR